jgi:hypothetical protein
MTPEQRRARAEESVAASFSRGMNAATHRWGVVCDLSAASALSAVPLVLLVRQAMGGALASPLTAAIGALAVAPIATSLGASLSMRAAREQVISWLAEKPFPIGNMNSLLVGISDQFSVVFAGAPLDRRDLQPALDRVSDDALWVGSSPERRTTDVKIGVPDGRMPLRSTHLRYVRFRRLVDEVLVPLHERHPIEAVHID